MHPLAMETLISIACTFCYTALHVVKSKLDGLKWRTWAASKCTKHQQKTTKHRSNPPLQYTHRHAINKLSRGMVDKRLALCLMARRSWIRFPAGAGPFSVEFACSPHACMGFLQMLQSPHHQNTLIGLSPVSTLDRGTGSESGVGPCDAAHCLSGMG